MRLLAPPVVGVLDLVRRIRPADLGRRRYEYYWADGDQVKKPIKLSAPAYVDALMTWVQSLLDNEQIFPCDEGAPRRPREGPAMLPRTGTSGPPALLLGHGGRGPERRRGRSARTPYAGTFGGAVCTFPPNFEETVRTIFKRLFRIFAHIYYSHFEQIERAGEEKHLNTCYKVGMRGVAGRDAGDA